MFFNFFNNSVIFQFYINDILQEYLDDFYTIYLDDILIYNELEMKHEIHVKHILQKLWEISLQIDVIKCEFHVIKVVYFDLIIIIEDICMNFIKIEIIVNWFQIFNVKDIQNFLEFVNFYYCFIFEFSWIAVSLTAFIKKNILFQ